MLKKYIVRLTDEERQILQGVVDRFKGSSRKVRRRFARIDLLRSQTLAWQVASNTKQRGVDWQYKIGDARRKLKSVYPKIIV